MNTSSSEFIAVRGIRLHVRRWGNPDAPMLFMLHGWMDVAASFQFVVDALSGDWQVLAPDMRGFGLSDWPVAERGGGNYWIQDYLADLDALLDYYVPGVGTPGVGTPRVGAPVDAPVNTPGLDASTSGVNLIGHSMGANIACVYAGVRPERVRRVVDLEGFGLAPSHAAQAPKRLRNWLDELRDPPQLKRYASLDEVAGRLIKTNPRLAARRARFLAEHWSKPDGEGRFMLLADPAHKLRGPTLYRLDEVMATWRKVSAKVLHVEAANSPTLAQIAGEIPLEEFKARFQAFPNWREKIIDEAGHMVHHDQPEQVAALIEGFCA
jgi:pimeloyl-ACP methyl ester carboxylesterase